MKSLNQLLIVSRSAPPGVSGSAHVLRALLDHDEGRQLIAVGGRSPTRHLDSEENLLLFPTELSVFGRGARFFSPIRQLLLRSVSARIEDVARSHHVARILCVFPDAFYCAASLSAAKRLGLPIDFWFHNTYADNRSGTAGVYARRLESQIIKEARRVFFISDALCDRFRKKYAADAARFHTLRHPVGELKGSNVIARGFASHVVRATLMGNINESNFDATARLLRALKNHPSIKITMCCPVPKMLLEARGIDLDGVDFRGYIPLGELDRLLLDTDLFLLPHGLQGGYSEEEYRTIFPTRAAHYMAQGRPILAHSPEGSGLTDFLREHGCALVVSSPSEEDIVNAFEGLHADYAIQEKIAQAALKAATMFQPDKILRTLTAEKS